MSLKQFSIRIASVPDREGLVAEIYYKDDQWAEISQEGERPEVLLLPPNDGDHWDFSCSEFLKVLNRAKEELVGEG